MNNYINLNIIVCIHWNTDQAPRVDFCLCKNIYHTSITTKFVRSYYGVVQHGRNLYVATMESFSVDEICTYLLWSHSAWTKCVRSYYGVIQRGRNLYVATMESFSVGEICT